MANFVRTHTFIWRMENFITIDKETSPAFFSLGMKWQLRFSRFKEDESHKFYLYLEGIHTSEILSTQQFRTTICFTENDGRRFLMKSAKYELKDKEWCVWVDYITNIYKTYGEIKDITFSVTIIPVDLTSFFEIQKCVEVDNESDCVKSLKEDFGNLYCDEELSDFNLKCGEEIFPVHKAVLSARSDFFSELIYSNMKGSNENTITVEDVESHILELVLTYMYSGEISQQSMETIHKVYTAAEKFGLEPLKEKCYSLLLDNFFTGDEENSDKAAEKELDNTKQSKVAETALRKTKEKELMRRIFRSREWGEFSHEFPHKAQEVCISVLLEK